MSSEAITLTILVIALASLGVLRPAMLFEFPVATSALMGAFIIPQIWRIEASGDLDDYPLKIVWIYMILCVVMTFIGFKAGAARKTGPAKSELEQFRTDYDLDKMLIGTCVLAAVGAVALFLTYRLAATATGAWGGALAFYVLIAGLLWYGAGLAWLVYLYTRRTSMLVLALIGFGTILVPILFSAKREPAFALAATILLGIFFVRKKSISRLILIPAFFLGSVLLNQAGAIRSYIGSSNSSLIGAFTDTNIASDSIKTGVYAETAGGVSDISEALASDEYTFLTPYYNQLVQSYVPAFILGHDLKDGMKLGSTEDESDTGSRRLVYMGATRTGFGDSFQSLHFFGCLLFFGIAYLMGYFWAKAKSGDIKAQLYYILLIPAGLKVFTESTSVFISVMPLMFASTGCVFWYARRKATDTAPASDVAHQGLSPADFSGSTPLR